MVTSLASTTPDPAPPPQAQHPDEPLEAWCLFLRWWASSPRPELANPSVLDLAYRYRWHERAALLDHRTAAARPLAEVTQGIALDSVTVLSVELEALAAECRANPGRQRLRDLTPLLQLITSMGGFGAITSGAEQDTEIDLSLATPEEKVVLFKALPILERIRRAKRK